MFVTNFLLGMLLKFINKDIINNSKHTDTCNVEVWSQQTFVEPIKLPALTWWVLVY